MSLRKFYIFLFCISLFSAFSQNAEQINKLRENLKTEEHDTVKLVDMISLSNLLFKTNYKEAVNYHEKAIALSKKLKRIDFQIDALNSMADGYWYTARYDKAFDNYYKAYHLADSIKDKAQTAFSLYNIGWLSCIDQKNYKDITYLYRSLKIYNELKDVDGIHRIYNAIGFCYTTKYQNEEVKADFDSAVYYLQAGIELIRDNKLYAKTKPFYVNLGDLFYAAADYNSSKFYYQKAHKYLEADADSSKLILLNYQIASCDYALTGSKQKLEIIKECSAYFKRKDHKDDLLGSLKRLAKALYSEKEYKQALEYYDAYSKLKEELDKLTYANNLQSMESSSNLEKANAKMIDLQQSNEIQELKNKRKTTYILFLVGIGIIITIIVFLLYKQNRLKQNSNQQLQDQNKIILEKKNEIEQSIEYAKGIQTSFLPDKELLDIFLPGNFILYKPKDIVSGDFYWFETSKDKKQILIACADSTGHGVPGALMSMVGINMLQQLCGVEKLKTPSTVLRSLNNEIKNALKQNTEQNKQRDGMDVALVHIDLTNKKLVFSGANRPLYIIRNKELIELKATKTAIGGFTEYNHEFEESEFQLQPKDLIVLSTDGYADQFGGEDGKKLMTKKLKSYLIEFSHLNHQQQLESIISAFNKWKGNYDQVDDVCLIGINIA